MTPTVAAIMLTVGITGLTMLVLPRGQGFSPGHAVALAIGVVGVTTCLLPWDAVSLPDRMSQAESTRRTVFAEERQAEALEEIRDSLDELMHQRCGAADGGVR